jgi:hypothetical protein
LKYRLFLPVVLAALLAIASTQNVFAATLDQKQETVSIFNSCIQTCDPIGQEFKPSLPVLEAVEVYIGTINGWAGDDTITLTVRQGTIGGPIIVTGSKSLVTGFKGWVYFPLTPVSVTPESTYVIRLQATKITFSWYYSPDALYSRGVAFENGAAIAVQGFTFRTYGSAATTSTTTKPSVGGVVLPTDSLTVLVPYLAMIGLVTVAATVYVTKRR